MLDSFQYAVFGWGVAVKRGVYTLHGERKVAVSEWWEVVTS